jgi:hypothetical protein
MSTLAQALGINLDLAIGPLVVGAMIVAFLHTLVLVQAVAYCQHLWHSDPVFIRVWVCIATILSTASVFVISAYAYRVAVSHWGDPTVLIGHNGLVDAGAGRLRSPLAFSSSMMSVNSPHWIVGCLSPVIPDLPHLSPVCRPAAGATKSHRASAAATVLSGSPSWPFFPFLPLGLWSAIS